MSTIRSPLIEAVSLLARVQPQDADQSRAALGARVFSYSDDFSFLWSLKDDEWSEIHGGALGWEFLSDLTGSHNSLPLIVVWNSTPSVVGMPLAVNLEDWTTPYDWIIALGSRIRRYGLAPEIDIVMIDAYSGRHPSSFGVRFFKSFQPRSGWLRIVRLGPERAEVGGGPAAATRILPWVEEIISATGPGWRESIRKPEDRSSSTQDELLMALRAWKRSALATEHRHSVSNVIGPSLLANHLVRSGWPGAESIALPETRHLRAFRRLLDEMFSEHDLPARARVSYGATRGSPLDAPRVRRDRFGVFSKGIRFLLVDDHSLLGFGEILRCLLAGDGSAEGTGHLSPHCLEADNSIDRILAWLLEATESTSVFGRSPQGCVYCGEEVSVGNESNRQQDAPGVALADVLVLDLRLFAETDSGKSAEASCLRTLLAYYHRRGLCRGDDPDSGLAGAVAVAAEAGRRRLEVLESEGDRPASSSSGGDLSSLAHLALLPLLVHHADPALPIVVFSSTQQRQVIDLLQCSESIITACRKPSLSGYEDTWSLDDACFSFLDAVDVALRLLELRVAWDGGKRLRLGSPPKCHVRDWSAPASAMRSAWLAYKPVSWRTESSRCRAMLEVWYRNYALTGRWHDFLSMPWEFVEGSLIHPHYIQEPNAGISGFGVDIAGRGLIARALEFCRHRKAHGYARVSEEGRSQDDEQAAGLCLWLLMLDFLNGRGQTHAREANQVAVKASGDLSTLLAHRHGAVREGLEAGRINWPIGAQPLVSFEGVSTPEFVMCAVVEAASCNGRHANPWIKGATVGAVARVIRGFADDAPRESMRVQGGVLKTASGLYLHSKSGKYNLQRDKETSSDTDEGAEFLAFWDVDRGEWAAARI